MTDTTNAEPPLPDHPWDGGWHLDEMRTIQQYGDARAAHAVAQKQGEIRDAERFRWLTEDHADGSTRAVCREILGRMGVMSYSAACTAIDSAMAGTYCLPDAATATAEQPGLTDDQWLDLASRHANRDWDSNQPDGYLNAVKSLCNDFAATAPAPEKREVTDAEIDALLYAELGVWRLGKTAMSHDDLHRIVRAAIALANGRGGA